MRSVIAKADGNRPPEWHAMPSCRLATASSNEVPKPSPQPNLTSPDSPKKPKKGGALRVDLKKSVRVKDVGIVQASSLSKSHPFSLPSLDKRRPAQCVYR
jgi:hypothetical protein